MHTHADSRKLGACHLDCLENLCPSFIRSLALGKFAFAQATAWTQHLIPNCLYWANLPVFSLAKKCCGTAVDAIYRLDFLLFHYIGILISLAFSVRPP